MPNKSYLAWLALFAEAIRDQEHLRHFNPSSDDVEVSINAADTAKAELIRHFDQFARQTSYLLVRGRKARGAQRLFVDRLFLAR